MAKEPDDKPGASSADGESPSPETNPPQDDSSAQPAEGSEQEELPLADQPGEPDTQTEFPEAEFPNVDSPDEQDEESTGEDEPVHDDQAQDAEVHAGEHGEDPHLAGELDPGHDDPYHDEYHHEHEDEHYDHHDKHHEEYHEEGHGSGGGGGYYEDDDDDEEEEEEYGGPVKPFLDHLEDLRLTVMKCAVTLAVGMMISLIGSSYIVDFLKRPLEKAKEMQKVLAQGNPNKRTIPVLIGDGIVGNVHEADLQKLEIAGVLKGVATNLSEITSLRLVPIQMLPDTNGSRYMLALHVDTNSSGDRKWNLELKLYGPMDPFMLALRIGLFGGLTISMPLIIFFIAQFVLPALRVREKKWLFKLSAFGSGLFFLGVAFAYLVIMGIAIWASVGFAEMLGMHADEWRGQEYISFVCMFMLGLGVAFQLPMVLLFLVKIRIIDYKNLSNWRMYAVVANLIVSAILTPTGDPITLLLVAIPLHMLYELSTLIAWIWYRREAKEEAEEAAQEAAEEAARKAAKEAAKEAAEEDDD
jgi:sec-independent protein translocase protein TatC